MFRNPRHRASLSGRHRAIVAVAVTLSLLVVVSTGVADPRRYGLSDRLEKHMMPDLTTGPLDPVYSPDGKWIAFAMRGDIWKIPVDGGEAVAVTKGPAYHFEPAWSPDGARLAFSMDTDGNLDIGVVSASGGAVERITTNSSVDVEPTWGRDGKTVYYVTTRADSGRRAGGGFRIFAYDVEKKTEAPIVSGYQPSLSPDGTQLAYVGSGGRGTGSGVWVKPLPDGAPKLLVEEELAYRTKPTWTPDGKSLLYVSDAEGSNDVRIIAATGGEPIRLTIDGRDEYSPAVSPDGQRFAFVSNRTGPTVLYTADIGGGRLDMWRAVPIRSRRPVVATGRVHIRVLGPDGKSVPARIYLGASDGRSYSPEGAFQRVAPVTETHYFHSRGDVDVVVPAGRTAVEALRGFEWKPGTATVDVPAGGTATAVIKLARLIDMPARGWYSSDNHVHDLHQGRFGLTHQTFFDELVAEDLHLTFGLIHMDGSKIMGRWDDLTGKPQPLSTPDYILQYGEEFRGAYGHVPLLGISKFVLPFSTGSGNNAYAAGTLDVDYIDAAHAQGGIAGFAHPFLTPLTEPAGGTGPMIPIDAALGKGDFYDVVSAFSDELASADVYYRILNSGFRLPVTGGTDNFSDAYRDGPPGDARGYVHIKGPLTVAKWMAAVKAQHTFATTGPMLFLDVAGREPGDAIALGASAPRSLFARAEATSIAPMGRLEILVNGKVVKTVSATADSLHLAFADSVAMPLGGWIAARVIGPVSRFVTDDYAFAHTSPVYVVRNGKPYTSAEDAQFLATYAQSVLTRAERQRWHSDAERDRFNSTVARARDIYKGIADRAAAGQ